MKILSIILALIITGCGYHSMSYYGDNIFGDGVYVEIILNPEVPESSIGVKDSINQAILTRFGNKIVSKERAYGVLSVKVNNIYRSILAYNSSGFASFYRTTLSLSYTYKGSKGENFTMSTSGFADYSADTTSTILAEQYRIDSITKASSSALDAFISKMAFYGSYGKVVKGPQDEDVDLILEGVEEIEDLNATKEHNQTDINATKPTL